MKRLFQLNVMVIALALASWLWAAEPTSTPEPPADEPEIVVVVTAERTEQPVSESIATTTVITAKDIREAGAQSAADVLRLVPGLALRQSGTPGALATVSIRGTNPNQSLVLVDGQRISSPAFFGGTDVSKFPVADIARIEVIRGPVSSLYGSEAIGGVINIITRKPLKTAGGETVESWGGHGRAERSLSINGADKNMQWKLTGSFPKFSGIRENSRYLASDLNGSVKLPSVAGWELSLRGERYQDSLGLPEADPFHTGYFDPNGHQWWVRETQDITARHELWDGDLTVRAYRNYQRLQNRDSDMFGDYESLVDSRIAGNSGTVEMNYSRTCGAHELLVGGEYRNDRYHDLEGGSYPSEQRQNIFNRAAFAQDRWQISERTDLVLGARMDDHSTAGSKVTPRIGINHELKPGTRLRASFGEGFRAPNFVELFYPSGPWGPGYSGNPDLKPETSRQYELGINFNGGANSLDLAVFDIQVKDLIMATSATPYENLQRAKQRGIELSLDHRYNKATVLNFTYTYLDALNETTGQQLLGQTRHKASITLAHTLKSWDLALTGRWNSGRGDLVFNPDTYASNRVTLPGKPVFDLTITRLGSGSMRPYLTIRNLNDAKYEEVAGYPAERRSVEAGLRSSW